MGCISRLRLCFALPGSAGKPVRGLLMSLSLPCGSPPTPSRTRHCATACEWELAQFGCELCVRSVEIVSCRKALF
jgi:hypothetical protein